MTFKRLTDLDVAGKRVFIRADLNVPQDDSLAITDDTRIRAALPGIRYALEKGAAVMVTSHLGRPTEGEFKPEDSLAPVATRMSELLGKPVRLVQNWVDGGFDVKPGEVVMLENSRCNKGEKKCNEELSQKMAALCDVWVMDAFGTAHRAEATTYGMGKYAKIACAGPCVASELEALAKALAAIIANAGTVVWNGPVGVFEMDAFANGTKALAAAVASSKAFTLAGGGDTVSAINVFKIEDKVGYISTAGGAFLEFLEGKRLPAVDILESRFKD